MHPAAIALLLILAMIILAKIGLMLYSKTAAAPPEPGPKRPAPNVRRLRRRVHFARSHKPRAGWYR